YRFPGFCRFLSPPNRPPPRHLALHPRSARQELTGRLLARQVIPARPSRASKIRVRSRTQPSWLQVRPARAPSLQLTNKVISAFCSDPVSTLSRKRENREKLADADRLMRSSLRARSRTWIGSVTLECGK